VVNNICFYIVRSAGGSGGLPPLNKICPPPPARGLACHNERFTIEEIIKIVATRCQILRLKCAKSFVGWGSAQIPLGKLTALPRPSSWILGGLLLRGRGRNEKRREERGGKKGERGGKRWRRGGMGREGAGSAPS